MQSDKPFPLPERFGRRKFWRLSKLLQYEGRQAEADALSLADDVLLTSRQVCERYGQISEMTLYRWVRAAETEAA